MALWLASIVVGPTVPWQAQKLLDALTGHWISDDTCAFIFLPVWALMIFAASVWWVRSWPPKENRDVMALGITVGAFSFLASLPIGLLAFLYAALSRGAW